MIQSKNSKLKWGLRPTYYSTLKKFSLDNSMYHMMFYCWTNDGYDMGDTLNQETFSIYSNIVCTGVWNWMKYRYLDKD